MHANTKLKDLEIDEVTKDVSYYVLIMDANGAGRAANPLDYPRRNPA
jgi:hypothetical protein